MLAFNQNSLKKLDQSVLINLGGAAGLASPLIKRVITLYQQDANQMVNGISHALSVMDFEQAFRLAHSLKSSSATIGAYVVAEIAKQIESALKAAAIYTAFKFGRDFAYRVSAFNGRVCHHSV
jgi:HPt (histidine-containing phosphotransfer) domain-containing protein